MTKVDRAARAGGSRVGEIARETNGFKIYGTYSGTGRAFRGERFVAEVRYFIKEVEETIDSELPLGRPSGEVAGQRTVFGYVRSGSADDLHDHLGARLTLDLQDGRALDFTVTQRISRDQCLIHALGGFRASPG